MLRSNQEAFVLPKPESPAGTGPPRGVNRSSVVAEAIREYLDRRAVAAAEAWHASLTGEDAATLAEFNAAW
jgi:hypothetical protein